MTTATRPLPPIISDFIAEIEHVVATSDDRRATIERLYASFAAILHDSTWLHADHRIAIPGQFSQYAIYRATDGMLSIMAMVVPPGVATPVHDHRAWGLVGVYQGQQREKVYRRLDDGSQPHHADLHQVAENILKPGDITTLVPPEGDIHMIETISSEPSISIHVLGNDIGCVHRHRYDVEHKTMHRFKSGYVNTACTAYRLTYQHLVVPDVQRTVAFYERMFGATRVEETRVHDVPWVRLDLHGTEIWISGEIMPGLQTHYGLVTDDFEEALAELKTRGVRFLSSAPLQVNTRRVVIVTDNDGQQLGIATSS
jgi:predicted metal-dependent enzyme (double-stranded beta helix superfamily)/catechol 2,3-dioxygenase-like lactoylglutathione lyase family enzyme